VTGSEVVDVDVVDDVDVEVGVVVVDDVDCVLVAVVV
jgi:hypothetical protein